MYIVFIGDITGRSPVWFTFAASATSHFSTDRKKSRIPCSNLNESRFPSSSQIPFPVKRFCFFPNPGSRKYRSRPCPGDLSRSCVLKTICALTVAQDLNLRCKTIGFPAPGFLVSNCSPFLHTETHSKRTIKVGQQNALKQVVQCFST